jgi:hypothetical protein
MAASLARRHVAHAVTAGGGMCLSPPAMAACATCRLARLAATQRWSFLTNYLKGGLF